MEKVIEPKDYTPEIKSAVLSIENRMRNTLVDFTEQDIKVFEREGNIYILANPILGTEPIFDEMGNFQEMIPMYNITIIYDKDWIKTELDSDKLKFIAKVPRTRILRPDLCAKITKADE